MRVEFVVRSERVRDLASTANLIAENLMLMLRNGLIDAVTYVHVKRAVAAFCSDMGLSDEEKENLIDLTGREIVEIACHWQRRIACEPTSTF